MGHILSEQSMAGGNKRALIFLCAGLVGIITASAAHAQLRIVDNNTGTAQADGGTQTARLPYASTVLQAIGAESVNGIAKPLDVLILQEQFTMELTTQSFVDVLNDLYDPVNRTMYARSTVNGAISNNGGPFAGAGGRPGLVYNTQTVQLINETQVGNVGTGEFQQPRATMRYEIRPVGYDASADFYVYDSHYRASDGTFENNSRLAEATSIRTDSDALGEGTHAIYAGDYNITSSNTTMFEHLLSSGNGQAFDPIDTLGVWHDNQFIGPTDIRHVHTQSPASNADKIPGYAGGGVDDRFDFQLTTGEFLDNEGLSIIPNSYHVFGNNGTHTINESINTGTGAFPTVLNALMNNTDHLPVVADYQLPAKMNAMLASVPTNVMHGESVGIDVMVENIANVLTANGADELDYTITVGGSLLGGGSGTAFPLAGADTSQIFLDTSATGFKTGLVTVSSSSQQAANPVFNFPVSFTVGGGSGGPVFGVIAKDTFDENLKLNSYSQNPAADTFADPQDGFQIYQVGVSSSIPNALKDDSTNGQSNDSLGVVNTAVKTDRWFGINDLENPNNTSGTGTVTWEFDIAGAFDMQVSIDMAAMGDFETEDTYNWTYQIDNGSILPLFTSSVDEDGMATYFMADGDPVVLNDPLSMMDAQNSILQLDNIFQTLTSQIVGIGDTLTIFLNAANNADEAYAFDNLIIEGTTFVEFLAADFNHDGNVDGLDLAEWQMDYGLGNGADADGDGDTDGADFLVWQRQYGQSTQPLLAASGAVPEPTGLVLLSLATFVAGNLGRQTRMNPTA